MENEASELYYIDRLEQLWDLDLSDPKKKHFFELEIEDCVRKAIAEAREMEKKKILAEIQRTNAQWWFEKTVHKIVHSTLPSELGRVTVEIEKDAINRLFASNAVKITRVA